MKSYRIILHIDMNCFFVACEIAKNPSLSGRPVVVAHDDQYGRGMVLSPTYEARRYGIKTTMKVRDAYKLCPNLTVVPPHYELYSAKSSEIYQYFISLTPKVEMASIDEAFLDITDLNVEGEIADFASKIQRYILDNLSLPSSIGIAPNKYLAKMASDIQKPLGIFILRKRDVPQILWPMPIGEMWGVGKKTAEHLSELNIKTIGDLANFTDLERLAKSVGPANAHSLIERAKGNDDSPVDYTPSNAQSVSGAHTFDADIFNIEYIKQTIKSLVNTVCYRLQSDNQVAQTIGLQIKYADFSHFNKSSKANVPTNEERPFYRHVESIFEEYYNPEIGVRYVGVYANRLQQANQPLRQLTIFDNLDEISKEEQVSKLLTDVKKTFGDQTINKGYYKHRQGDNQ